MANKMVDKDKIRRSIYESNCRVHGFIESLEGYSGLFCDCNNVEEHDEECMKIAFEKDINNLSEYIIEKRKEIEDALVSGDKQ